ncbi:chlorophyll synthase, chloroplastic-like isoform 1 [Corchorus olitorius]|uniref:Chlorophyll synthase, chloroplastic-like isoform 1 n=1 Tax=Corchorus olitorius TaxID=93759 RepID=A0A1R3J2H9_9ROSI|nr:chlorophyll synthase, chloroplastic-like isoform 1 [Corchorus olitorius]
MYSYFLRLVSSSDSLKLEFGDKWKIRLQLTKPITWPPLVWGVVCGAAASGNFHWNFGGCCQINSLHDNVSTMSHRLYSDDLSPMRVEVDLTTEGLAKFWVLQMEEDGFGLVFSLWLGIQFLGTTILDQ